MTETKRRGKGGKSFSSKKKSERKGLLGVFGVMTGGCRFYCAAQGGRDM